MKRWLSRIWRWSPVATLPIGIVFAYWALGTYRHFESFRIEYNSHPVDVNLYDVGVDEWNNLTRHARLAATTKSLASIPAARSLNTVQLFVSEPEVAKLQSNLPYSGYRYVKGQLMYPDGLHQVKVRYRGDFLKHWGYDKKSIRVKTRKEELFWGMRQFNLIVPKFPSQLNNYLGYRLARILGLISPRSELVNVSLNGRNLGMHEFTEQLEEGTLRRWDRMPGDLYSGDLIGKSQVRGTTNMVFDQPRLWEKIAANNHYDLESRTPLERLVQVLSESPSEQTQARLSKLLDMDAWGRFGAFELLTQTHHYDEYHNWRLFWDPWALKFEPGVWDPTPWAPEMRPHPSTDDPIGLDMVTSRLHVWLHRNGDFLAARHRALRDFYESGKVQRFLAEADWAVAAAKEAVALDPNVRPTNAATVSRGMRTFREFIDRCVRDVRLGHVEAHGTVSYTRPDQDGVMALEVMGRQPVDEVVLRFQRPVKRLASALLRIHRAGEPSTIDLSGGVVAQGNTLHIPARMFSQLRPYFRYKVGRHMRQHMLREIPGYYELVVDAVGADNPLMDVLVTRADRQHRANPVAKLQPTELEWLFRSAVARPLQEPLVWRGVLRIDADREVLDDVIIEPGTTILLAHNASLLFRGRVTAIGTPDRRIEFLPAQPELGPFGTIAINGPSCSGSTFRHCEVRGGSGLQMPLEEYCSMFSIHNCTDVRIENCVFADNFLFDDMIHAIYSEVMFDDVELRNARSDALDCDISRVVVRHSKFTGSGNDHLDLMATWAVVHDCEFEHAGDKAISIGEGSSLIAVRGLFQSCERGLEAKDGSIAYVMNSEIRECNLALNAYRKNWRYDTGGQLTVQQSTFADNGMPTADSNSKILILDCQYDWNIPEAGGPARPNYVEMRKSRGKARPRHQNTPPFPENLQHMEAMARQVWHTVSMDVRGGGRAR